MSLVITVKHGEGFRIGDNIFIQVKKDKLGVKVLIDAPKKLKIERLTNRGIG